MNRQNNVSMNMIVARTSTVEVWAALGLIKPHNTGSLITMSSFSWPLYPFRGQGEGAAPLNGSPVPPGPYLSISGFSTLLKGTSAVLEKKITVYLSICWDLLLPSTLHRQKRLFWSVFHSLKVARMLLTIPHWLQETTVVVCACVERAWMCDCSWFAHTCHCSTNLDSHSEGVSVQ